MQPCNCFIKMYENCTTFEEKMNIPCIKFQYNSNMVALGYNGDGYVYYDCPKCKECHSKLGLTYRKYKSSNAIFNDFGNGRYELVVYDKPFYVLEDHCNIKGTINERNYRKIDTQEYGTLLIPKSEDIRDGHLYHSLSKCSTRAQNNYYSKALCNTWKYFCTFTISPQVCDRYNDKDVKGLWDLFRQRLVKAYPNCRYLCVPERHSNGALHFHSLLWTEQDLPLKPYYDKNGRVQSRTGADLWTFDLWKYGICTLAVLPPEDNQSAVINYLITYTTKQSNLGWGQRRFYATRNLLEKDNCNYMEEDTSDITIKYDLIQYSRKDGCTVYRNFNIKPKED